MKNEKSYNLKSSILWVIVLLIFFVATSFLSQKYNTNNFTIKPISIENFKKGFISGQKINFLHPFSSIELLIMSFSKDEDFIITFWASWCQPCIEELPIINQFNKDGILKVLAINLDEVDRIDQAKQQLKNLANSLEFISGINDKFIENNEVNQIPSHWYVKHHMIKGKWVGQLPWLNPKFISLIKSTEVH